MTPVIQTKVVVRNSKGEIVVNGNCYAAAIATMLDLPITEVPNIEVFFGTSFDYKWLMNAWLRERHGVKIDWAEEYDIFHSEFEEGQRYEELTAAKTCWQAETEWRKDLEKQLADVHGKIEDLNNWHHSHI